MKERGLNVRTIEVLACSSVIGKIYVGILVDRVGGVIVGLIEDEQGDFRAGRGCVDQIFTLKEIGEKA